MKVQSICLDEIEILKRFANMELHFPRHNGRRFFPSVNFYLNFNDDPINTIKEEAENMLLFVGMGMYNAIVKTESLNGAAGFIKLTDDMNAEITLEKNICKNADIVLSTLAHEICHKILYKNNIYFGKILEIEDEIYADLATFYVGFGYFTMKGYLIENEQILNCSSQKFGYLTPDTYARAYQLMNAINGVVKDSDYKDFPEHVRREIDFATPQCSLSSIRELNCDSVSQLFKQTLSDAADIKLLLDLIKSAIEGNSLKLRERFNEINKCFYDFGDKKDFEWHKISMAYQYVANKKLDKTSKESINQFKNALTNVLDFLMESGFVLKTSDEEVNFKKECPICGHPIRNKLDSKMYHFICPACNSHFVINNDIHFIMSAVRKNREKRYKDEKTILNSPTLIKEMESQKQENASLKIQLDRIKSKWWYKLLSHF